MIMKEKLEKIFEIYTQKELAIILGITQWRLLVKMKNEYNFDKSETDLLNEMYNNINN